MEYGGYVFLRLYRFVIIVDGLFKVLVNVCSVFCLLVRLSDVMFEDVVKKYYWDEVLVMMDNL